MHDSMLLYCSQQRLREWTAYGKQPKQVGFKFQICFIRLCAQRVERLAEETASCAGQNHIKDFFIRKTVSPQFVYVILAYVTRLGNDLLRKRHYRDFFGGKPGVAEVPDNCRQLIRIKEILTEQRSVGEHSVGTFKRHG